MARKDDPVFNVKFVQFVENQPCLWNYTHPCYSKKEEVQKAWQHVANDIKDTVRNSRERWRTIRSSFLRSLKLARTQTGRGKRKYYLSKYLQFLIPFTKSRACQRQLPAAMAQSQAQSQTQTQSQSQSQTQSQAQPNTSSSAQTQSNPNGGMVLRKPSTTTAAAAAAATSTFLDGVAPMTRIAHMRLLGHQMHYDERDDDSNGSFPSEADVQQSEEEHEPQQQQQQEDQVQLETPLRMHAIKVEPQLGTDKLAAGQQHSLVSLPVKMAAALRSNVEWSVAEWLKGSCNQLQFHNNNNNNNNNNISNMASHLAATPPPPAAITPAPAAPPAPPATAAAPVTNLSTPLDADSSFLISLHPYLKEMTGKQNRRFRQKVVGLIDNVLDNLDI